MSSRRLHLRLLVPAVAILVVAACSQPTDQGPQATFIDGALSMPDALPVALGVATFFVHIAPDALKPAAVTEVDEGLFIGPIANLDANGNFSLELPAGEELPAALMQDAEASIYNVESMADCSLSASDPAVKLTGAAFEGITVPGAMILTVDGLMPALSTAEALSETPTEEEFVAARFQTWVYATGPTTLVTEPAVCVDSFGLSVDVTLQAGWNQLEWTFDVDELGVPEGIRLNNSTADELHVMPWGLF